MISSFYTSPENREQLIILDVLLVTLERRQQMNNGRTRLTKVDDNVPTKAIRTEIVISTFSERLYFRAHIFANCLDLFLARRDDVVFFFKLRREISYHVYDKLSIQLNLHVTGFFFLLPKHQNELQTQKGMTSMENSYKTIQPKFVF